MNEELLEIRKRIQDKEEIVRKLKLVSVHKEKVNNSDQVESPIKLIPVHSQHDAKELEEMISRWSEACVKALQELHEALNGQISMEELLKNLNIENGLVGYRPEDDCFTADSNK